MKKISILLITTFLFASYAFAERNPISADHSTQTAAAPLVSTDDEDGSTNPLTDTDDNEALFIDKTMNVVPKTDHDEDATLHYTIDAAYPQISGENLSAQALQFNAVINQMVTDEINQFKNNVRFDAVHMNTLPEEVRKNTFKIDYDIDVIKPDEKTTLVSVRLTIEGMQAGRPHPFHTHRVLNFDLTNGKELALDDLFKKNSKYLNAIAKYSNAKLNETLQDKWMINNGTKVDPKNFKNWNIESDSLLITFDEYQVAPYVNGPQEVEIPLSELSHLLATNAPVMAEFKQSSTLTTKKIATADEKAKKLNIG